MFSALQEVVSVEKKTEKLFESTRRLWELTKDVERKLEAAKEDMSTRLALTHEAGRLSAEAERLEEMQNKLNVLRRGLGLPLVDASVVCTDD